MIEVTDEMQQFFENELWDIGYNHPRWKHQRDRVIKRIIELHEANKPKPEPVAYYLPDQGGIRSAQFRIASGISEYEKPYFSNGWIPLYTTPPTREPLSDDDIWRIYDEGDNVSSSLEFARSIEKAHGIGVK